MPWEKLGWPWDGDKNERTLQYLCFVFFFVASCGPFFGWKVLRTNEKCYHSDPHHHLCCLCFFDFVISIVIALMPQAYIFIDVTYRWGWAQLDMYNWTGYGKEQEAKAYGHFKVNPVCLGVLLCSHFCSMTSAPFQECALDRQVVRDAFTCSCREGSCEVGLPVGTLKLPMEGACVSFFHCLGFANCTTNRINSKTGETSFWQSTGEFSWQSTNRGMRPLCAVLDSCLAFVVAELTAAWIREKRKSALPSSTSRTALLPDSRVGGNESDVDDIVSVETVAV